MLHHAPGEEHRGEFIARRLARGHDLALDVRLGRVVAALHEHAAGDAADEHVVLGVGALGRDELLHQPQVLLFLEERAGVGLEVGRDDDFAEDLADGARQRLGEHAIADDDAAEGCLLVGREGFVPRLAQILVAADAAGVRVLEDGDGRLAELLDQLGRGGDVQDVVIREVLAVELGEVLVECAVERACLVGILAVAQPGDAGQRDGEGGGGFLLLVEVVRDGLVVAGRGDEDLDAEPLAELERGRAVVVAHGFQHVGVIRGIDHHCHEAVVFRRAAEHGGAADVDLLDGLFERGAGLRNRLLEGVEIHHHEVDGQDVVRLRLGDVLGVVAQMEEPAVDLGVERLHAPVHHLGKAGVFADLDDLDALLREQLRGAAGGDDFDAHRLQRAGKWNEPRLVRN